MSDKIKSIVLVALSAVLIFGLATWNILADDIEYSESERRVLASLPEISAKTIFNGKFTKEFEAYTQDQFPLRNEFRSLKTWTVLFGLNQMENNDLYIENGYISKLDYPLKQPMMDNAAEKFTKIYNKFINGTNTKVYLSIVPDKNYFLAPEYGHLHYDYASMIDSFKASVPFMEYIDVTDKLSIDDYYRTDTHWRQEAIEDVAKHLANSMGTELNAEYTVNIVDGPFYGVYCGQIAIPQKPDVLKYVTLDSFKDVKVTSYDTGSPVVKQIYNMEAAHGRDPYEMFMAGSDALLVVENPNATTDKELVIFRDSFGSSISPYFIEAYSKITLVDIRYLPSNQLDKYIEFQGQDVLFLYSTLVLNNSETLK